MAKILTLKPGEPLTGLDLEAVAAAAKACKPVAFPTDTVYGLGSTALVKAALRRLYEVKARDAMKPLPILVESLEAAKRWVEWTPAAEALARRFWPGALTLVLKPTKEGRLLTFQEFPTLAVRVPAHPVPLSLLKAAGVPLAATSANLSGRPPLSTGVEVAEVFGDKVAYVVDGGRADGVESSVVDATGSPIRVLREGALSRETLLAAAAA